MKKSMRFTILAVAAAAMIMTGCGKKSGEGAKNGQTLAPVDMRVVMDTHEAFPGHDEFDCYGRQLEMLFPEEAKDTVDADIDIWLFRGKEGYIDLPEYAESENPFLAQAADAYNAAALGWGLWSNYEVYAWKDFEMEEEALTASCNVNVSVFKDKRFRQGAEKYKQDVLEMYRKGSESWSDDYNPGTALDAFMKDLADTFYKPWEEEDSTEFILHDTYKKLKALSNDTYARYQKLTDEKSRVREALRILQYSKDFTHQCSFWLRWADTHTENYGEDFWLLATGTQLLKSGTYYPELQKIWVIWRDLYQMQFGGASRASEIPNDYYNEVRALCYRTCLKWIEKHPDDIAAMNCASQLAGRANLLRLGSNPFGNEAMVEIMEECPGRLGREVY